MNAAVSPALAPALSAAALFALSAVSPVPAAPLGSQGIWRVSVEKVDGITGEACVIANSSEAEGGRRETPGIRVIPASGRMLVDPDRSLSGVITGIAALEHRSDRRQPTRVLEHRMRVDDGEIVSASEKDPRFGDWDVGRSLADFGGFIDSMANGRLLRYEWAIERSEKSYEYPLEGFGAMLELARTAPACRAAE